MTKVGVDQAQPAQSALSEGIFGQGWNDQTPLVADDDEFYDAVTIDENADLAADVARQLDQSCCQLSRAELCQRNTSAVETLQGLNLAFF